MPEFNNPFVQKIYADGDFDYNPPEWRQNLDEYNARNGQFQHESEHAKDYVIKDDEIALKHPVNGAMVKVTDDGCVDLFAGDQLGIRLDPNTNSALIFADNIHFFGKTVNFRTQPNGLVWNGYNFNPSLYYEDSIESSLKFKGTKNYSGVQKDVSVSPMLKNSNVTQYSEGMLSILTELGLPVDDIK